MAAAGKAPPSLPDSYSHRSSLPPDTAVLPAADRPTHPPPSRAVDVNEDEDEATVPYSRNPPTGTDYHDRGVEPIPNSSRPQADVDHDRHPRRIHLFRHQRMCLHPAPIVTHFKSQPHHLSIWIFMSHVSRFDPIIDEHKRRPEHFLLSFIQPSFLPKHICHHLRQRQGLDRLIQAVHHAGHVNPMLLPEFVHRLHRADRRQRLPTHPSPLVRQPNACDDHPRLVRQLPPSSTHFRCPPASRWPAASSIGQTCVAVTAGIDCPHRYLIEVGNVGNRVAHPQRTTPMADLICIDHAVVATIPTAC
ncbi:hypothetical protein ACLOJK_007633 [Asimina triloba]